MKNIVKFLLFILVTSMIIFFLLIGCTGSKHVGRGKSTVDSTHYKDLLAQLMVARLDVERLASQLREMEYAGVDFEPAPCPTLPNIDSACSKDSMIKVIRQYDEYIRTLKNTVKIHADGSIEAEGRVRSARYGRELAIIQYKELQRKYDSLVEVKQKEKVVVNTVTKTVEVHKKRGLQWWLCILGFVAGCSFWHHRKKLNPLQYLNKK